MIPSRMLWWYKAPESKQDPVSFLGTLYFFLKKHDVSVSKGEAKNIRQ